MSFVIFLGPLLQLQHPIEMLNHYTCKLEVALDNCNIVVPRGQSSAKLDHVHCNHVLLTSMKVFCLFGIYSHCYSFEIAYSCHLNDGTT